MVADFVRGRRPKYWPNSSDTFRFIWWSISHMAVWAIWAGNSSSLDAVELIDIAQDFALHVEQLGAVLVQGAQDIQFQHAQFPVGDHQEVAAAAGRVKEFQPGQALMKLGQPFPLVFDPVEFGPQLVQEQRPDQLEDVLFRGVVRPEMAPLLLIHDRLEQRPEDRRRNPAPVQGAAVKQQLSRMSRSKAAVRRCSANRLPLT